MNTEDKLAYVSRMIQITDIPGYNNCAIVSQYIMEAVKDHGIGFPEIEGMLRLLNSKIYLIGLPLFFFKNKYSVISRLPHTDEFFQYALWIELNGKPAIDDLIKRNNLTDVDISLTKTGFLCLDQRDKV